MPQESNALDVSARGVAVTERGLIEHAQALATTGYALLSPEQLTAVVDVSVSALQALRPSWDDLPRDEYLRDGGRYRHRRHSCFVHEVQRDELQLAAHRAHWQPTDYNALHGGMERWFQPIRPPVQTAPAWSHLLVGLGRVFASLQPVPRWYIEAHQFRIDTAAGIGRPTPEGAHRDGVDYVAVILARRENVRGGETRVFEAQGISGVRFTMSEPWTALLLDDARVIHETTPIQSQLSQHDEPAAGIRDTLVLTYRKHGFQAPNAAS